MARFIYGNELNASLERLLETAETSLILVSPYIKLHDRYAYILKERLDDPGLDITLVFGKNEDDLSKSMSKTELEFFMAFPNIQIRYEKRLHAKYYANESMAILTSMNLYSYSQDNNIEAGIELEVDSIGKKAANRLMNNTSLEAQAFQYFERVIHQAEIIYENKPQFEKSLMGLKNKYIGYKTTTNQIQQLFSSKQSNATPIKEAKTEPARRIPNPKLATPAHQQGYCVRTGVPIPFNTKRPMSDAAYDIWKKYADENYPEKFCHFSGEASNGETSFSKPILRKNWSRAKAAHGL